MLRRLAVLGCLGTLLPVMLVIAGLLTAGDVAARRYATGQLADRVRSAVPETAGVHARIRAFPFVARALFDRPLDDVGARVDSLKVAGGLTFSHLDVDLRNVVADGHALWNEQAVRLRRIGRGTVSVDVTDGALTSLFGRPVRVAGGQVKVAVLGSEVAATVAVTPERLLVMRIGLLPAVSIPIPSGRILPCLPSLAYGAGVVHLRCTFTSVPQAFVEVASPPPAA